MVNDFSKIVSLFGESADARGRFRGFGRSVPSSDLQHAKERSIQLKFAPVTFSGIGQQFKDFNRPSISLFSLPERAAIDRGVARFLPSGDGRLGFTRFSPMSRENFGPLIRRGRKLLGQY